MKCRSVHCAVARKSFDVESRSWVNLMNSVRKQIEVSLDVDDEDEETEVMPEDIREKRMDSFSISETSSDSMSEEEYVDAEDGNGKKDWPYNTR